MCWAVGNDATSEGDHIVETLRGAGEIVRGGDDRAAAWDLITREVPRFTKYEEKTDRLIPVVRLRRRG